MTALATAPVGLTFSAKENYRSDVLVNFGEPIAVAGFLADYPEQKRECIHALTVEIERRIVELNDLIAADPRLGKQFRIGHSYVTPAYPLETGETRRWFEQVVETEIGPLLEEYWFDAPDEAQKACARLTQGW